MVEASGLGQEGQVLSVTLATIRPESALEARDDTVHVDMTGADAPMLSDDERANTALVFASSTGCLAADIRFAQSLHGEDIKPAMFPSARITEFSPIPSSFTYERIQIDPEIA